MHVLSLVWKEVAAVSLDLAVWRRLAARAILEDRTLIRGLEPDYQIEFRMWATIAARSEFDPAAEPTVHGGRDVMDAAFMVALRRGLMGPAEPCPLCDGKTGSP